ncbi:MAG: hypothetical protein WCR68_02145 [Candidatus Dojkabacteria bacterium]|jgi:hypothetical protein|nr:hypothetical protein [Candidatus Dojkabacteria bacterium]
MKDLIKATIVVLPLEEIIFNHEVMMKPFGDEKKLIVLKYIRDNNSYLMSDGNTYKRNQFIPLCKFAISVDEIGTISILGRLQYNCQNKYKEGDQVYGKIAVIHNKIRLNDIVMVSSRINQKGLDMTSYYYGVVSDVKLNQPDTVQVTLPDGDILVIPKSMLTIINREPTCKIFNVIKKQ